MDTPLLRDGPTAAPLTLVLAHGAGAPMDSPFLQEIAAGVGARGVPVVRFEFPYMAQRRASGGRRPPDREPVLLETWRSVVRRLGGGEGLVLGGKSMGGRMASMVADEVRAAGLVCLGYPFHPPGRPERLRTAHLAALATPALIVQGERDPFGGREEAPRWTLSPSVRLVWAPDGNHDLAPRKSSGRTHADNVTLAIDAIVSFMQT